MSGDHIPDNQYRGLPHCSTVSAGHSILAIVAEVTILLSLPCQAWTYHSAASWPPCRSLRYCGLRRSPLASYRLCAQLGARPAVCATCRWLAFSWNLLLAAGMSVIVFQPIAIQLRQQSLDILYPGR